MRNPLPVLAITLACLLALPVSAGAQVAGGSSSVFDPTAPLNPFSELLLGAGKPPPVQPPGSWGRLVFNDDFNYAASKGGGRTPPPTLDKRVWRTDDPRAPAGQPWWNTTNPNVILPGNSTIQLKLNWSNGQVTHSGRLTNWDLWSLAPPAPGDSILAEAKIKTPNVQGTWPTFWLTALSWPPEVDVLESFGRPSIASATYHSQNSSGTRGGYTQRNVSGSWTSGFHSYAVRWHYDKLEFFYDRVKVLEAKPDTGNQERVWIVFSHQGLSEARQPWSNSNQQLVGSGSALETIDRISIWRGGIGPPPG